MSSAGENRVLLALLLGIVAAGANVVGGSLIARAKSLRRYLISSRWAPDSCWLRR
jgi:hypothetical protein